MKTSQVLLDRWMHLLVEDVVSMVAKTMQEASLSAWAVLGDWFAWWTRFSCRKGPVIGVLPQMREVTRFPKGLRL